MISKKNRTRVSPSERKRWKNEGIFAFKNFISFIGCNKLGFLLDNQVFAVKLQGKGVRQAYKHINFHIDDSYTQSYGAGLTVTAKSLFIGQESAYGFNANKLGGKPLLL